MARQLRIDFPGAFHHVMNRGACRQPTFLADFDRRDFLGLWQEATVRFGIIVLAYALMGNHYHFLVVSPDAQLSQTLQWIGHCYTQRFNRRHDRDGALFRGRFYSVLVDSDSYLDRVARYIERNPLEAGLVTPDRLASYEWSSLQQYLTPRPSNWVDTGPLLGRLGSRSGYLQNVLSDRDDSELQRFYQQAQQEGLVLGRQSFVDQLPPQATTHAALVAGIPEISLDEIDHAVVEVLGGLNPGGRLVATWLGQREGRASRQELVDRYHYPTVQAVSNALYSARKDPEIQRRRVMVLNYLGRSDLAA